MKLYDITVHVRDEYRTTVFADDWKAAYEQARQEYRDGVYPERLHLSTAVNAVNTRFPCWFTTKNIKEICRNWEDVLTNLERFNNKNGYTVLPPFAGGGQRLIINGNLGSKLVVHLTPIEEGENNPRKTEEEINEA
jgi:hypothetical protein